MAEARVASAVASLVFDGDRLLLGKRFEEAVFTGWQCPGGFIAMGESFAQAARRHALEKAGLQLESVSRGPVTNNIFPTDPPRHTVTHYLLCRDFSIQNPQQFSDPEFEWQWIKLSQIPGERFLPLDILLKQYDISEL